MGLEELQEVLQEVLQEELQVEEHKADEVEVEEDIAEVREVGLVHEEEEDMEISQLFVMLVEFQDITQESVQMLLDMEMHGRERHQRYQ